jgi:hypothetical protein
MNLVAYDKVDNIINKKRSWINVHTKTLYSREINYHKYFCFGKKYDNVLDTTVFYIIMLDDEALDRPSFKTTVTSNGCLKINIKAIWDECGFNTIKSKYINISLKHTEHTDDGDIFEFCPDYL